LNDEIATRVLVAFSSSDIEATRELCREDVLVWGTDTGERWSDLAALVDALDGMRALHLHAAWLTPPRTGPGWAAGIARYSGASIEAMDVRVTLTFDEDGRLSHGHFSVEATAGA
jgi:hypothetical protein